MLGVKRPEKFSSFVEIEQSVRISLFFCAWQDDRNPPTAQKLDVTGQDPSFNLMILNSTNLSLVFHSRKRF
jgi:hypothetical protein